jgi:hypothetical protein
MRLNAGCRSRPWPVFARYSASTITVGFTHCAFGRQRREICDLEEAGIGTDSANALLQRMLAKIETLSAERDRLIREEKLKAPAYPSGKRINGTPARRRV